MNRRDFLIGNASGIVVGAAAGYALSHMGGQPAQQPAPVVQAGDDNVIQGRGGLWRDRANAKHSFGQWGEDLLVAQMLDVFNLDKPDYIDIGAWDPVIGSNTYLFYLAGGRGVLVEPNPTYVAKLRSARPGDTVIPAGIGTGGESQADYYVIEGDGQLNTFSKETADKLKAANPKAIKEVQKMPLLDLNKVLSEHFKVAPALLSVDAEGMDLPILKSLDFDKWRPKVFCVETPAEVNQPIVDLMKSKGYGLRALNLVNSVFVDEKVFGKG
jgi:FkbM family methyltransferase